MIFLVTYSRKCANVVRHFNHAIYRLVSFRLEVVLDAKLGFLEYLQELRATLTGFLLILVCQSYLDWIITAMNVKTAVFYDTN